MASITRTQVSTTELRVGQSLKMTATLQGVKNPDTVVFEVIEHSGGKIAPVVIDTIEKNVAAKATSAQASWTVKLASEQATRGGLPEYKVRARLRSGGEGVGSASMTFGKVLAARWIPPEDTKAEQPGDGALTSIAFERDDEVTMEVETERLDGFIVDFVIQRRERNDAAYREVDRVNDVMISGGFARAPWRVDPARAKEIGGGLFRFDVKLRHGSCPHVYTPEDGSSGLAGHLKTVKIYFSLYYQVPDGAFKRAAQTFERALKGGSTWDDEDCEYLVYSFQRKSEYLAYWRAIAALMVNRASDSTILEAHVFSHASKGGVVDGIEFSDGTLSQPELQGLPRLRFDAKGLLVLHGCNTGNKGDRSWSPAGELARRQFVTTIGQAGDANFSTQDGVRVRIDASSTEVYLWTYDPETDQKVPGIVFPR